MKYIKKILIITLLISFITPPAWCNAVTKIYSSHYNTLQEKITHDSNGGYFVETLDTFETPQTDISIYSTSNIKSTSKTIRYYNSNDVLCWSYTLKASFNVNSRSSSVYINSSASANIYKTTWSIASENHSGSGNVATGTIKMKTSKTSVPRTITIKCDKNGNFI